MIVDWALPATRWVLYADLAIVFGVPMAAAITGIRDRIDRWQRTLALAALAGIAIGGLGFVLTVVAMAGLPPGEFDRCLVLPLLTGTAFGWALIVRSTALVLFAGLTLAPVPWRRAPSILLGAVASATLAWSGHAAASQGAAGVLRLAGDIFHLLGALSWVGALGLFAVLLWRPQATTPALSQQLARALARFSLGGSVIVVLLAVTGAANLLFLVPLAELPQLLHAPYGRLLLVKLALFSGMLGLAGLNRFMLVPALEQASHDDERLAAISRLRLSVPLELLAALTVLGLGALLGRLDPLGIGT